MRVKSHAIYYNTFIRYLSRFARVYLHFFRGFFTFFTKKSRLQRSKRLFLYFSTFFVAIFRFSSVGIFAKWQAAKCPFFTSIMGAGMR